MLKQTLKKIATALFPSAMQKRQQAQALQHLPKPFVKDLWRLKPGDICIDIGANVGSIAVLMAARGATVHAFEPNGKALQSLHGKAQRYPAITVHAAAAGTSNRQTKLFLHHNAANSAEDLTQASSLKAGKPNVNPNTFEEVEEVDFAAFLNNLPGPVTLIKMDVEGYEIELVNHLLDHADLGKVGHIYVETHEHKWPQLEGQTTSMKERVNAMGLSDKFNFDWV